MVCEYFQVSLLKERKRTSSAGDWALRLFIIAVSSADVVLHQIPLHLWQSTGVSFMVMVFCLGPGLRSFLWTGALAPGQDGHRKNREYKWREIFFQSANVLIGLMRS